jgi:hypothetical protein
MKHATTNLERLLGLNPVRATEQLKIAKKLSDKKTSSREKTEEEFV